MWWCLGDPWNPWSEGWWPTGAEFGSVAHKGRVLDVRRLELGRQGELAWPKGTVRVAGAERSDSGDRINCSLKVIEIVTNYADFVVLKVTVYNVQFMLIHFVLMYLQPSMQCN